MSRYLCPNCGCDEFIVMGKTRSFYHLKTDEFCGRSYITRADMIDVTTDEVELAVCSECEKEVNYGTLEGEETADEAQ